MEIKQAKRTIDIATVLFLTLMALLFFSCAGQKIVTDKEMWPDYFERVTVDGSAANLILSTTNTGELQDILQHLIRESDAGLKAWEKQLADQYRQESKLHPTRHAHDDTQATREIINEMQGQCTEKLFQAAVDTDGLKSKLVLLDRLTTSLAEKINRPRPLSF